MTDFVWLPFLFIFLLIIFLIFIGRSSPVTPKRTKRRQTNDDSDCSIINPPLFSPPEEPLSIFPREESHSSTPAPEPDFQILGIVSDMNAPSNDFGNGGVLEVGAADSNSTFDSGSTFDNGSTFDSSGFGGGGDFGGGGAGGDWSSSGGDGSS